MGTYVIETDSARIETHAKDIETACTQVLDNVTRIFSTKDERKLTVKYGAGLTAKLSQLPE